MGSQDIGQMRWHRTEVTSPHLARPVSVVAAKRIPYLQNGNRLETLNLYLPDTPETAAVVERPVSSLLNLNARGAAPCYQVHIHGGAWRDPQLTATSIEPTVAHAFCAFDASSPIIAVASIDYTISQFPTHPTLPYEAAKDDHSDPAREAVHPLHVSDVLHAFALLRTFGVSDRSYILTGHSCGACLAFQSILQPPRYYGLGDVADAPCPAAILGLNGLYDLPGLVYGLGTSHEHLRDDYEMFLSNAFGADKRKWPAASPARFGPAGISERVRDGKAPSLIVLDQSTEDQLVPMNQRERLETNLGRVAGMQVVRGQRCTGKHAAPWEQGIMIWDSLRDILAMLGE